MVQISRSKDYWIEFEEKWYVLSVDQWLLVPSIDIFVGGIGVSKAAAVLGVKDSLIYGWIYSGKVKGWRENPKRWVDVKDLLRFLSEHQESYDFFAFQDHIFKVYEDIRRDIIGNVGNIGIKEVREVRIDG